MGKSKKPKTQVTQYYMSEHFGVCIGVVDEVPEIIVDEKLAATGGSSPLTVSNSELFGGIRKEGGVEGLIYVLDGAATQTLPDVLAQKLGRADGDDCPGFRGLLSLFFTGNPASSNRGFYWRANSPFLPGVWAKVKRIHKRSDGSAQWYDEKAEIGTPPATDDYFVKMRVRWLNWDPGANPTYIATPDDGTRTITFADTSTSDDYTTETIGTGFEFIWVNEELAAQEIDLQMQFPSGSVPADMRAIVDYIRPGDADYTVLYPKAGSWSLANAEGYFDISALFPRNWQFDMPGPNQGTPTGDMNPAHIIYECLTDSTWGMGTPASAIDEDSFIEAADTLFDELFGLTMLWTRQSTIESFVQEVLDHIQAVLYTDPETGLLTIDLIRDDYDPDSLDVIDPDNADLSNFSRKLWGDIVNEIVVTWTNPANEQEETITVQDDASIAIQGGIVSDSRNYYGVRNATLAQALAYRDLRSSGQPLASVDIEVDRTQYLLRPGRLVKLTWPEYSLTELVMRVQTVDYGRPGDPTIKASLMEDVFGLDIGAYDTPPTTAFEDPSAAPVDLDPVVIFTLPYFFAANSSVGVNIEVPEYPEVLAGILASTDLQDAYAYDLQDDVTLTNGSTETQVLATNGIIGTTLTTEELYLEASSDGVTLADIDGDTIPQVGGFVIIGDGTEETDEIAMVDVDNGDGTFDLVRGVLDTVPRAWPAGTRVWFVNDTTVYEDPLIRSAAETVDYKLLTKTSLGTLDAGDATEQSHTLTERPWLPNRPANVQAYGTAFSSLEFPIDATARYPSSLEVTWSNRNRLQEDSQVLEWGAANVTPESGQTTTIEVRDPDGTLLATHDGLTGTSYDIPEGSFGSEGLVELRIYSERSDADGDFESLQYFSHWVLVAASARLTESGELRYTEAGIIRRIEG